MTTNPWPALALARLRDGPARMPFVLAEDARIVLGSVAVAHLPRLRAFPDAFVELRSALGLRLPVGERDARLGEIHAQLRDEGLIRAWRGEPYPLRDRQGGEHGTIERAASRFWGTLTLGAHCNGFVADPRGRPSHLWVACRADTKPTDPGRLDNLVGGGVPRGQSPREAVVREGWEEAGLVEGQFAGLAEGGVLEIDADVPEGRQHEQLHVFELSLPPGFTPRAVDGEVAWHRLMPVGEALARVAAGEFTTDAALATLVFASRHGLLDEPSAPGADAIRAPEFAPAHRRALDGLVLAPSLVSGGSGRRSTIQSH